MNYVSQLKATVFRHEGKAAPAPPGARQREMLEYLASELGGEKPDPALGGPSSVEIANELGASRDVVHQLMRRMENRGQVRRVGIVKVGRMDNVNCTCWQITEAGVEHLAKLREKAS